MNVAAAGRHTRSEILSQPETWRTTLRQLEQLDPSGFPDVSQFDQVICCGCGSTYYLSRWAARTCEALSGTISRASPSSDLLLFPEAWRQSGRRTLMIAVSRSGETTETVLALKRFLEDGAGQAVVITCYPESSMARMAQHLIAVPGGQEQSVAQTRSFTNMLLGSLWLFTRQIPTGMADRLAQSGSALLAMHAKTAEALGRNETIQRFFFLGSGALYGLANEAMLKMKETSLSYAEAFHYHEFRHGPMSMVDRHSLLVGLLHDSAREQQFAVLRQMKALGARTLGLLDRDDGGVNGTLDSSVHFDSGIPEAWRAPLYLPVLQLMAYERAIQNGLNPDLPTNLTSVVVLDDSLQ